VGERERERKICEYKGDRWYVDESKIEKERLGKK